MRVAFNVVASSLALAGLMAGAASHATSVADLPLKASVLAKPNVIFGVDDSGSTDWEILLDTSQGLVWWNGSTSWDTAAGRPLRVSGSNSASYLFPIGLAESGKGGSTYATSSAFSRPLPPTVEFAWLRSAKFNPQYYNPDITYEPWAPAYLDGAKRSYGNAPPTAAPAHPAISTSNTLNLTAMTDASVTAAGFRFYVYSGMRVPSGSRLAATSTTGGACSGSTERTLSLTPSRNHLVATGSCWASIPYFPATYWHAEDCTGAVAGNTAPSDATCIFAPDGTTKLKRYEIKPGNYETPAQYNAAIQNFANWFTYYRKRKLSMAAAMGQVLENISGLRLGLLPFNSASTSTTPPAITMYDSDTVNPDGSENPANNRFRIIGDAYKLRTAYNVSGPTPTHATMSHIGRQFHNNTNIIQYACQRNAMFIATDGFADASPSGLSVPSYSSSTYGSGAPFQTTGAKTLSDLALAYFTVRARTGLTEGRVPLPPNTGSNPDTNRDLHVNTYGLSLGARGTLWPNTVDPFVTAPTWPTPVASDPTMLDDLWHATINGRGQMYMADTPEQTAAGIRAGLTDILSALGAQSGLAVSTVNLQRGDGRAYYGTYNPAGWTGDFSAYSIDGASGAVGTNRAWSVGEQLLARDWTTRIIATHNGSTGTTFTAASVGSIVNNDGSGGNFGNTAEVMNYLRGDRSNEGTKFRTRTSLMGAVITSEAAIDRDTGVAYFASGEGMLHAVDIRTAQGKELWAYVPGAVLPEIGKTVARTYSFKTKLDGSPVIAKLGASGKLLVAGMGAAGRSYYAIDVSNPRGLGESELASSVKWEFPAAGDSATRAKMGKTLGRPIVVPLNNGGQAVLVTSGYGTGDGRGRLWMLDPTTGAIIHEFVTPDGTAGDAEAGLAQVSAFLDGNGTVRYVYGGDLLGNVWRFDLNDRPEAPHKVAILKDAVGNVQPVTAAPELMRHMDKRVVLVGTGRLLDLTDFGSTRVQSFYAIVDGSTLSNARSTLKRQTYNPANTPPMSNTAVDWATDRGWYFDLPTGEQENTRPVLANGAIAFVTNMAGRYDCSASSYIYVLDVLTGGQFRDANFVNQTLSSTANSSGATGLMTSGGDGPPPPPCTGDNCPPPPAGNNSNCRHVVFGTQTTEGERRLTALNCPAINPVKNAWREGRERRTGP